MSKTEPDPADVRAGKRVRMRRLMLQMSQTKLADALGITFQQVQKYEWGTNRISASRLQHIAHILEVPIPFFFDGLPDQATASSAVAVGDVTSSPSYMYDFLASKDGIALAQAFMRIRERDVRRSIVNVVEAIATMF